MRLTAPFRASELYDTNAHPFMVFAFYDLADKLMLVPIERMRELSERIGDPQVNVALIGMTARNGSTLITTMLNQ